MYLTRLKLNQYRNYTSLDIAPAPGINVLTGDNGQGKTNAIEAVFLCALGRSHRTTKDAELIMRGTAGAYAGVDIACGGISRTVEIKLISGERKKIFIDRNLAQKTGELMGVLNAVMFSPEDLSLVKQGPQERRRFMDMELCQIQPSYFYKLQQYNAALKQRNALLKDDMGALRPGVLAVWDEQLSTLAEHIINARCGFLDELSTIARDIHRDIAGGREELFIHYRPNVDMDSPRGVRDAMLEALQQSAAEDIRRGFTSVGPHRDDIGMELNGADVRTFGSQGQQRTAALSMKLSELALITGRTGETPVLLLDDVFSELDDYRQAALVNATSHCQTFLTCASLAGIRKAGIKDMRIYECENGTLKG